MHTKRTEMHLTAKSAAAFKLLSPKPRRGLNFEIE